MVLKLLDERRELPNFAGFECLFYYCDLIFENIFPMNSKIADKHFDMLRKIVRPSSGRYKRKIYNK